MENINWGFYIIIPLFILFIVYAVWGLDKVLRIYYTYYYELMNKVNKMKLYQFKAFFLSLYLLLLSYLLFVNTPHNGRGSSHWQFIYGNKAHYSVFEETGWSINTNVLIIILLSAALFLYLLYKLIEVLIEKK